MKKNFVLLMFGAVLAGAILLPGAFFLFRSNVLAQSDATPIRPTYGPVISPEQSATLVATMEATPETAASASPTTIPTETPTSTPEPPTVTPGPSPTPLPSLRSSVMGIQIHGFLTDEQFSQMLIRAAELGVGWVKVQINWAQFEPQPGQFSMEYQAMVLNVQRASNRGFKTLLSVAKAPEPRPRIGRVPPMFAATRLARRMIRRCLLTS
jgi:hypothetical protein